MEGGGDSAEGKASLRLGMSQFLGSIVHLAREKRLRWKVVACGTRNKAYDALMNAAKASPATFNVLLVDSEAPVADLHSPRTHLSQQDHWHLAEVGDDSVHLMIQIMETWLIADPGAVARYYGPKSALPAAQDLEAVDKARIYEALERAMARTQKRRYHKIRHAAGLLKAIKAEIVRRRCPSCERLF